MSNPTPATGSDRSQEAIARRHLKRHVLKVADRLRAVAADLDAYANRDLDKVDGSTIHPSYASVVGDVQHAVISGLANLHLGQLTTDAYDADQGRLAGDDHG